MLSTGVGGVLSSVASTISERGKTKHVFVVTNGEAEDRIVQVAPSGVAGSVAIARGLAAGEQIVAKVTPDIVDGTAISASGATGAAPAPAAAKPADAKPADAKPAAPAAGSATK